MNKRLVAYFSASGSTAKLAKNLAVAADAALYEIRPAVPYERKDLNWMDKKSRSTLEMQDPDCRPELADTDAPVADAEVVFLGFPIWWYREPSIIDSFLDAYDFSGKTLVPFLTSGGSNLGEGQERIEKLAKDARVLRGKRFSARASEKELKSWIAGLQLDGVLMVLYVLHGSDRRVAMAEIVGAAKHGHDVRVRIHLIVTAHEVQVVLRVFGRLLLPRDPGPADAVVAADRAVIPRDERRKAFFGRRAAMSFRNAVAQKVDLFVSDVHVSPCRWRLVKPTAIRIQLMIFRFT